MKQHYLYLLCAALLAGCGKTKNAKTDAAQDRMQHRIEHNEVTVDTLQRRDFMRELISNGRLAASKRSTLSFEVSGTIAAIAAKNGSRVGAGEPIARIDTSDYALQLHKARLALDKARLGFYDVLVGQGYQAGDTVTPPAGVMQLARIRSGYADATASLLSARRSLAHCTLRAPFAGKVADVEQQVYEKSKGEFCTLLDDSRQLVVPKSAVVIRDNLEVLFRYKDGRAQWTYVHTSLANSREYVVEANLDRGAELNPGDLVIVSGNLNLADGSEVSLGREQ